MTRINVVPVEELSDGFLQSEHYEIVRVYRLVRKAMLTEEPDLSAVPTYRMGTGHVRFFYPRLHFIQNRENDLYIEMQFRLLPLTREIENTSDIPLSWFGKYEPTPEALQINRNRLTERTNYAMRRIMGGYFIPK